MYYSLNEAESLLRSQPVLSQSRNTLRFKGPEGSLPYLQVPAICPYPQQDTSSLCFPIQLPDDPFVLHITV
jgi:hypothetical protein